LVTLAVVPSGRVMLAALLPIVAVGRWGERG